MAGQSSEGGRGSLGALKQAVTSGPLKLEIALGRGQEMGGEGFAGGAGGQAGRFPRTRMGQGSQPRGERTHPGLLCSQAKPVGRVPHWFLWDRARSSWEQAPSGTGEPLLTLPCTGMGQPFL